MAPPFLGPVFTDDGPLLVEALVGRKGTHPEAHRRATRLVVDDYGDAVCYERRCGSCMRWLPLDFAWFAPRRDHIGRGMQGRCRECVRVDNRLRYGDADYACRARDVRRIDYRLRREVATGRHVSDLPTITPFSGPVVNGREGRVPAGQLVVHVQRFMARRALTEAAALAQLSVGQRNWYAWTHEPDRRVEFDTADAVLSALGLNPWDVWCPEDDREAFELAARLWGFDYREAM